MQRFGIMAFMAVTVFTLSISAPLFGASDHIKPYGNLYVFFGYAQTNTYDSGENEETDRDAIYSINEDSNLGFNFSYEKYKGVFELGISDYDDDRKVKVRKVYGIYNSQIGKLMIGQAYNPYVKYSHEAANYYRSKGFGALYEDPTTQLKLSSSYGVYIDIIKPYVGSRKLYREQEVDSPGAAAGSTNPEYMLVEVEREITTQLSLDNIESMIPKIVLGYEHDGKMVKANAGVACNAYKINKSGDIKFNKNWIISYLVYLNSSLRFGNLFMNLSGGYAINPANFGIAVQSSGNLTYHGGAAASIFNIATGEYEIKDTWNIQAYMEFGYDISSSINLILGGGYSVVDYPVEHTEQDKAYEIYINSKINIGRLIALTPSISYYDFLKDRDEKKEGSEFYGGVLATVSFY